MSLLLSWLGEEIEKVPLASVVAVALSTPLTANLTVLEARPVSPSSE